MTWFIDRTFLAAVNPQAKSIFSPVSKPLPKLSWRTGYFEQKRETVP